MDSVGFECIAAQSRSMSRGSEWLGRGKQWGVEVGFEECLSGAAGTEIRKAEK